MRPGAIERGQSMSQVYPVPPTYAAHTRCSAAQYTEEYAASVSDPDAYWRRIGQRLDWMKPFTRVRDVSFAVEDFRIRWFDDGELNVSANCLDRHLATKRDATAIIWEGDDPSASRHITFGELHEQVCRLANVMKGLGVRRGDRVTLYLPMIPEAAVAMLACTRIGAIHSIVFGGFSPESLASRIVDCGSKLVITADEGLRGAKKVPLKAAYAIMRTYAEARGEAAPEYNVFRKAMGPLKRVDGEMCYDGVTLRNSHSA
jgi:acetyl-CoA synthetase